MAESMIQSPKRRPNMNRFLAFRILSPSTTSCSSTHQQLNGLYEACAKRNQQDARATDQPSSSDVGTNIAHCAPKNICKKVQNTC